MGHWKAIHYNKDGNLIDYVIDPREEQVFDPGKIIEPSVEETVEKISAVTDEAATSEPDISYVAQANEVLDRTLEAINSGLKQLGHITSEAKTDAINKITELKDRIKALYNQMKPFILLLLQNWIRNTLELLSIYQVLLLKHLTYHQQF